MSPTEHSIVRLFPDMDPEEFTILKLDIRDNGLKVPILLWRGQLIDGRHRLRACRELGIEPSFETVECSEGDLPSLVWSLNRVRRQLSHSQRAMIANIISMYSVPHRPKASAGAGISAQLCAVNSQENDKPGTTSEVSPRGQPNVTPILRELRAQSRAFNPHAISAPNGAVNSQNQPGAAKMYGVSRRHVQRAKAVYEADQTLAQKVLQGEITVTGALKAIEERQNPPKIEPARDQPNLVHRDHLSSNSHFDLYRHNILRFHGK
jgi:hypothetical protein